MKLAIWVVLALTGCGLIGCSGSPNSSAFSGSAGVTPADAPATAEEYEAKNGMIPPAKK